MSARSAFEARVASAFDAAGVDHVVLHRGGRDSDLDVAVSRSGLATVDALLRGGTLGRLVQRLDYGTPFSRYYVLRVDEPGRRYRALDVACDPWGIGRYGPTIRLALERRPGAGAAHLAVKRAVKGVRDERDAEALRRALAGDGDAARSLLRETLGTDGESPEAIAKAVARSRRRPRALCLRAWFGGKRVIARLRRPTGLAICLAGPDGVGKSTLTQGLLAVRGGPFRRSVRLGQRRGFLPPPARLLGRPRVLGETPHGRAPSGPAGSLLRLAYLWLDALVGWWPKVGLPRFASTLVVLERGFDDLAVDPRRYRLTVPTRLVRLLARLLPRPDLVVVLDAPAAAVRARKPELDAAEIERQRLVWRERASRAHDRVRLVDATRPPDEVLEQTLAVLDDHLAARRPELHTAAFALRCLGGLRSDGRRYRIVRRRGAARWLLPEGPTRYGPQSAGLYRPGRPADALAARALDVVAGRAGEIVTVADRPPLAAAIGALLGRGDLELAAALGHETRRPARVVFAVRSGGRLVAYAKASASGAALERERRILELVAAHRPQTFAVPRVLGSVAVDGLTALVLEPIALRGRTDREPAWAEADALAELAGMGAALAPEVRAGAGLVPVHGDFAPWNCGRTADGRLAIWDWEEAGVGRPLEDLFHWLIARRAAFAAGSLAEVVELALRPSPLVRRLCRALGVDEDAAPSGLAAAAARAARHGWPVDPVLQALRAAR